MISKREVAEVFDASTERRLSSASHALSPEPSTSISSAALSLRVDPLLSDSRMTGKSVYNLDLMTESEWEEFAVYRLAYSTHAMRHVAETPILAEGKVLGALHFAASHPNPGLRGRRPAPR